MLPANLDEVSPSHISALVSEKTSERRTPEYKEKLPGNSDQDKKEFLADVCSFANLTGGDIVYGIKDERDGDGRPTGIPESIIGLAGSNLPAERERLESIIRDGIKPRIPNVQTIEREIDGHGSVLVLRVARSWVKPHMVTYRGTSRFYSRHSTGKYQLDVQEIGRAFAEQRSLGEQLRAWRNDRVTKTLADEGPIQLDGFSSLLVHFVPASALAGPHAAGTWSVPHDVKVTVRPSSLWHSTSFRYNADGFVVFSLKGERGSFSYVQLFRNGCLEYGDGYILNVGNERGRPGDIPSIAFEQKLVETFANGVSTLTRLGIEDPIYFSCTLLGVKDSRLSRDNIPFYGDEIQHRFDRQVIQSPDLEIDRNEPSPYRSVLLPTVDSIWQANGYEETPWLRKWGLDANRRPASSE